LLKIHRSAAKIHLDPSPQVGLMSVPV